uniref:Uncharacterized protein n=1 Tax=Anopheles coluzzii TaxID=1518534 RepID=A0A8W7PH49_ANOCL
MDVPQAQPKLAVQIAEPFVVLVPGAVEVDRTVEPLLNHNPPARLVLLVAPHRDRFLEGILGPYLVHTGHCERDLAAGRIRRRLLITGERQSGRHAAGCVTLQQILAKLFLRYEMVLFGQQLGNIALQDGKVLLRVLVAQPEQRDRCGGLLRNPG